MVIGVGGDIDVRLVDVGLAAMGDPKLAADIARDLKKPLRADQRDHARQQEGPDGKWPKRKLGGRRRVLGKLPAAIKVTARGSMVSAVSRASWSGAHQDGAVVGRGARLPARPFLWLSNELLELAHDVAVDRVMRVY